MRLPGGQLLGYCTNVHPYDSLPGLIAVLRGETAALASRLREGETPLLPPGEPLGVGLWLPATVASSVVADPEPLRDALRDAGLHAFTVNAFPYGDFHVGRVKDEVFRPTWADERRLHFTLQAAEALAALLPEGAEGSVSTHSGGYKPWGGPPAADVARGLLAAADGLSRLHERTGRRIVLALEPEPLSLLETTDETVAFFGRWLLPAGERAARHLGVCFDACHQAVEFEDMAESVAALRGAGITIAKVQLSSALRVARPSRDAAALAPYADDRWFHQVVARQADGALRRIADLPEALAAGAGSDREWRVHFHVPIFADAMDEAGALATTRPELAALLALVAGGAVTRHLEIETYSWGMIPAARRAALGVPTLQDCLLREFGWVRAQLA